MKNLFKTEFDKIMASTKINEASVENLIKDILAEVSEEEIPMSRRQLVEEAIAELKFNKDELSELLSNYTKMLMDSKMAAKVAEVRSVLQEVAPETFEDLMGLMPVVSDVYENPKYENRKRLRDRMVKVFARVSDEELKKLVDAEKSLLKMVRSHVEAAPKSSPAAAPKE